MNKEEKEAIEKLQVHVSNFEHGHEESVLLNFIFKQEEKIKKQQKEIDKLRTITQNYDVIDGFTGNDSRIIVCDRKYVIDGTFKRNYIFKSKIREKIDEIQNYTFMNEEEIKQQDYAIERLKELLGEEYE